MEVFDEIHIQALEKEGSAYKKERNTILERIPSEFHDALLLAERFVLPMENEEVERVTDEIVAIINESGPNFAPLVEEYILGIGLF